MTSPFGTILLVANPAAGRGRAAVLQRLRDGLDARGLQHEVARTGAAGEATRLAAEAVERGIRFVVAVGGDGTVHEVVNGLVDAGSGPRADDLVLGVVPAGSGSDFVRTFGIDRSPEQLAGHLDGEGLFPLDIGRVRYRDQRGGELARVFANIADVGFTASVTAAANRLPRVMGPTRYTVAALTTLRRFELVPVTVSVDHTEITDELSTVVVANGQFFGGGMKVAPRALPDDGRFNVQVWRGSPGHVLRLLPRVRTGEHLPNEDIREYQSSTVRVRAERPLRIEADGEVLGVTDAAFDLLPRALSLKI